MLFQSTGSRQYVVTHPSCSVHGHDRLHLPNVQRPREEFIVSLPLPYSLTSAAFCDENLHFVNAPFCSKRRRASLERYLRHRLMPPVGVIKRRRGGTSTLIDTVKRDVLTIPIEKENMPNSQSEDDSFDEIMPPLRASRPDAEHLAHLEQLPGAVHDKYASSASLGRSFEYLFE